MSDAPQTITADLLEAAEALAPRANDRERGHVAAVRRWAEGDYEGAVEGWGRTAADAW